MFILRRRALSAVDSPLFAGESYSVNKIYYFQLFEKFTFLEQLFFFALLWMSRHQGRRAPVNDRK